MDAKKICQKHKDKIITFVISGTIFIGILSVIALVSGTIMRLFGFQYESADSIILFFIIATIISFPFNLIAGVLPKALYVISFSDNDFNCYYFVFTSVSGKR